ncbi:MAG: phosphatase PAP2 family protein [Halothiobacillaceae bacterium]|jgi:undecaprenyl-diphosphatase|nr:phosphatase PAP2 family protein [Halothiobacillaceae bacterium]MDY0050433.1 phosphatase PAP2 family protein [Halothiobacillaceae bacterium]
MNDSRAAILLERYLGWEQALVVWANRLHRRRAARWVFGRASRLGDGIGWYVLLALLLVVHGTEAALPAVAALGSAVVGVGLYLLIKRVTARPRPLDAHRGLDVSVAPLDKYSFPSGHTLHAVNFAAQIVAFDANWAWIALPFAGMVMASRLVLGLHYLSDVLAGALLGGLIAATTLSLMGA